MTDDYCDKHVDIVKELGVVKVELVTIKQALRDIKDILDRTYPRHVTWIIAFLASALSLACTIIFTSR